MHNNLYKTDGFSFKTLIIPTSAGVRDYSVSTTFANGLPRDAVLCGVFCRVYPTSGALAYNGQPLINRFVQGAAFLNLQRTDGFALLQDVSYDTLSNAIQYFQPTPVKDLDFDGSQLFVSRAVTDAQIVDNEFFELVFLYIDPCDPEPVQPQMQLRNFALLDGERFKLLEVPVNSSNRIYQLSTSLSVGLPNEAILTGLGLNESRSPTNRSPITTNAAQATFINLKQNGRTYVDNLPFEVAQNVVPRMYFNKFYFPLTPRKVKNVDWDNSNIQIVDPSRVTQPDSVVLLGLHYVMP